jgi:hypothetical protein
MGGSVGMSGKEVSWQVKRKKLFLSKLMKSMWRGGKPEGYVPSFLQAFWFFALHERASGLASQARSMPDGRD